MPLSSVDPDQYCSMVHNILMPCFGIHAYDQHLFFFQYEINSRIDMHKLEAFFSDTLIPGLLRHYSRRRREPLSLHLQQACGDLIGKNIIYFTLNKLSLRKKTF